MIDNNKISLRQIQALIIVSSFGFLIVSVPFGVTDAGGTAGWIFVLLGGLITAAIMAMAVSCRIGNWLVDTRIGNLISLIFAVKIVLCGGIWLSFFSETMGQMLLPKTQVWIISLLTIVSVLYMAQKGEETRARFAEISFGLIFIFLVFIFLLSAPNVRAGNLLPINANGGVGATFYMVSAAFGIEYMLFASPGLRGEHKAKMVFIAGVVCTVLLAIVVAFTIGVFGVNGVLERQWAVLQIMDTIDFPFSILERQDVLMMGFWIASIYVFISGAVFYSGNILKFYAKKSKNISVMLITAAIIFIISLFFQNVIHVTEVMEKARILNVITEVFIVLAFIFGRGIGK